MKYFIITTMAVMACLHASVMSQSPVMPFNDRLPRAGQALSENPMPEMPVEPMRTIDFDSLNMAFTGNWPGGQSFSISSSATGDTLFVGEGGLLNVMDVTDPYNPVQIADIRARAIIDHSYYDAATNRLYLAAYFSGIEVWELGDFTAPSRICRIPTSSYPRGGVYAEGNFVYIATVADGFYVADISNLNNPVMVGHVAIPGNPLVWDSDYQGHYAYLAAGNSGLRVVDFSNPASPVIAGISAGVTTGVRVRDNFAYVTASNSGLRILNITNPASITQQGLCTIPGYPVRVTLSGNYAYVANSTTGTGGGVNVVDISNPSAPVLVTTYPGYQTYVAGGGDVIGATGGTEGCLILDVSDPSQPVQASAIPLAGFLYEIAVEGTLGYTGSNGFRVFDLSDLSNPVQIGYHSTPGSLVVVSDTVAVYIGKSMTANNPVNVMSIADPSQPYKLGHYMAPVMTWDIAVKGQYAFVACWWDGFRVIDFSDPANPVFKVRRFGWSSGATPGVDFCYVQALDIYENYLYLIDYLPFPDEDTKGLYTFDITDPLNPQFVSRYATLLSSGQDIRALGDYVYVADGVGGLEVIDVSDPLLPVTAGYCSIPDGATGVDVSWPFVFVSDYILGGVQVVDVSIPEQPFVTAYYKPTGVFAMGVTVDGNYAFAGDGVCGFQVYDLLIATGMAFPQPGDDTGFVIYPNPASREIMVEIPEVQPRNKIAIYNMNGKQLLQQQITRERTVIDVGHLPSGIYMIRLSGEGMAETRRMVKW